MQFKAISFLSVIMLSTSIIAKAGVGFPNSKEMEYIERALLNENYGEIRTIFHEWDFHEFELYIYNFDKFLPLFGARTGNCFGEQTKEYFQGFL